jgi:hypothetical protein
MAALRNFANARKNWCRGNPVGDTLKKKLSFEIIINNNNNTYLLTILVNIQMAYNTNSTKHK